MNVPELLRMPEHEYSDLMDLVLDGLVHRLAENCWVPVGVPITPEVRAAALAPLPAADFAASHTTAHWVWWGPGRAPWQLDFTTLRRRRIRRSDPFRVHERTLPESERLEVSGIWVTTPLRTLYDCVHRVIVETAPARAREATAALLAGADSRTRHQFAGYLESLGKRPYIGRVRDVAATLA